MTEAEKLEALIRKAVDGGFYEFAGGMFGKPEFVVLPEDRFGHIKVHVKDWPSEYYSAEAIIFNKDFTRALFGEEPEYEMDLYRPEGYQINLKNFEWHLQQAVISDDPIDYMYHAVFDQ